MGPGRGRDGIDQQVEDASVREDLVQLLAEREQWDEHEVADGDDDD